jgi:hypothetical protein
MGLGLCLQCLGEIIAHGDDAPSPRFGVTLAPLPQTLMTAQGPTMVFVAVPACWEHLRQASAPGEPKRPLLVANGGLR